MLRKIGISESIKTTQVGGFCPYWTMVDGQVNVADTAEEIILSLPGDKRVIDPVAFLELLQFNYILGNRTLVQGVQRMPWRAVLTGNGVVERRPPIPHNNRYASPQKAAQTLRELLEEELYNITQNRKRVFLLLTGGLDSRVVAGVLKRLEPQLHARIECVTWGQPESRDVVYASRIAAWYDWEHHHLPYDHELTWSNIIRGAIWGGAEVAGLHLHGEEWFKSIQPEDLVVAASFGDSVGRAEFGSVHLKNLSRVPLRSKHRLLHPSLVGDLITLAEKDRETAWEGVEETGPGWVRLELDMQENYMRRMICHAMDYIRQFCSLHQAFTSYKVVSYMWSLSLDCRTDNIYYQLLKELDSKLYSLPYARTGIAPDGSTEHDPKLSKEYHEWGKWLRNELRSRLEPLVFSSGLHKLGLFHGGPYIRRLWDRWLGEPINELGNGQNIVKLCSLELLRRHFQLQPCRRPTYWQDVILDVKRHSFTKVREIFPGVPK